MFERIKYCLQLRKLEDEHDRIRKEYTKHAEGLSGTELENVLAEATSMMEPVVLEIDRLKTRRICQIANSLMVPLPDVNDEGLWEDHPYAGVRVLTSKGIWKLRNDIRQEKRERREVVRFWCLLLTGIIGAIAGVIAAMTGLVVVLTR